MRIFVAGTGFTGARIARALVDAGHAVWSMNRSGRANLPSGVRLLAGDVLSPASLEPLSELPGMDLMISTLSGTGQKDPEAYRALYVDGPRRLSERLKWNGPSRVWLLGSTGVYGESEGGWVDETTPTEPLHRGGKVQVEAEHAIRAGCDACCVLRLSGLYGPGRVRLIRQALRKRSWYKPEVWSNQIHGDDVARAVAFLAGRNDPPPPVLLLSDDLPVKRREVFEWVRAESGLPEGLLNEDHPHRRGRNRGNKRVSNRRLRELGYRLKYPTFREGLAPLIGEVTSRVSS